MGEKKAADGKEENFMAFQGKQRILYSIFQITGVLTLIEWGINHLILTLELPIS